MAKKPGQKGGEGPKRERATAPVQLEKKLARMAAVIATHDGVTQSELLAPVVRQFLITNYRRVVKEMGTEAESLEDD